MQETGFYAMGAPAGLKELDNSSETVFCHAR